MVLGKVRALAIYFDSLNENNLPVFSGGDMVSGRVVVEVTGDVRVKSLDVHARGVAKVRWTESRNAGANTTYTQNYTEEVEYLHHYDTLIGEERGETADVAVCVRVCVCAVCVSQQRCSTSSVQNFCCFCGKLSGSRSGDARQDARGSQKGAAAPATVVLMQQLGVDAVRGSSVLQLPHSPAALSFQLGASPEERTEEFGGNPPRRSRHRLVSYQREKLRRCAKHFDKNHKRGG